MKKNKKVVLLKWLKSWISFGVAVGLWKGESAYAVNKMAKMF